MIRFLRFFTPVLLLITLDAPLFSQSLAPTVIATDGGFSTALSGTLSWTLGEPVSETFTNTNNILTQGFHQPDILLVSTAGPKFVLNPIVYPNPARSVIFIDLSQLPKGEYSIELFDLLGKKITDRIYQGGLITPLSLQVADLANGLYLLTISTSDFNQSFKVIKAN